MIIASELGAPEWYSSDDINALAAVVHSRLVEVRCGWCNFLIDGKVCPVSNPIQAFFVKTPDGKTVKLSGIEQPEYAEDGSFVALHPYAVMHNPPDSSTK